MPLSIPVTWSDAHRLHAPDTAVWVGVPFAADELPERAERIRTALEDAGAAVANASSHPDDALLAVHDPGLVEFLRTAWSAWNASATAAEARQDAQGSNPGCRRPFPRGPALGASTP